MQPTDQRVAPEAIAHAASLVGRGEYRPALLALEQLLAKESQSADGWNWYAKLLLQLGRLPEAQRAASNAVGLAPGIADGHYLLGRVCKAMGQPLQAVQHYRRALQIDPRDVNCCNSLGVALRALGKSEEAIACYRMALALAPGHAESTHNLAQALAAAGQQQEADALRSSAAPRLEQELARCTAEAVRLHDRGSYTEAVAQWTEALRLAPESAPLLFGLANSQVSMDQWDQALAALQKAIALQPDFYDAIELARGLTTTVGLSEPASHYARRAHQLRPSDLLRIQQALVPPAILESAQHIREVRRELDQSVAALLAQPLSIESPISAAGGYVGFYLAYHGECNRDLQRRIAQLFVHACPALQWQAPHCREPRYPAGRIRIGLASEYLRSHSIGKTTRGLLAQLPRERYEVFAINLPSRRSGEDELSQWMRARSDHWIALHGPLASAREQIAGLKLDILFWQDIGMSAYAYYLAFARLAPVQCVSFGHPDTTGIPNMDYFVSNDLFEPADASAHYSEQLFMLHDLPTLAYYYRPTFAPTLAPTSASGATRSSFGLAEDEHLYLCAQTLFKLHPDFDAILAQILRRDPRGRVILLRGYSSETWTRQLLERFRRNLPDVADRVSFIDRLGSAGFLQLLELADVALDTIHFNGMNSSLEAFAVGTPVVTLPSRLQRGRHTQAMYRKMELPECIARDGAHYADLAVDIATRPDWRHGLKQRILERNAVLFEDPRVISEFDRCFESALRART